jgi:hypothetical protein
LNKEAYLKVAGFLRHSDGSILDFEGKEIFLSLTRFLDLIKNNERCFICGVNRKEAAFNDEHVVPDWVQRAFSLRDKSIQLPNGTKFPYRKYVLACCQQCNSFLGREFEQPISNAIKLGNEKFSTWYQGEIFRVFLWMNLIYLKTHLKDNLLRMSRDLRDPNAKIGDLHDWSQMHHCHALIRAVKNGVAIDVTTTLGSMFCLHLGGWADQDSFDYRDHQPTQTMMLRLGNVAFVASLNDSGGVLQGLMPKIEKLEGDISKVQLLEIFTEFQFMNSHLRYRPDYCTVWDQESSSFMIKGILPEKFELCELDFSMRRYLLKQNILSSIPNFCFNGFTIEETLEKLSQDDVTFLPS